MEELTYNEYHTSFLGQMSQAEYNKFIFVAKAIILDYLLDLTQTEERFCAYEMMDELYKWAERDNIKSIANDNYIITYRSSQTMQYRMNQIYQKYHSVVVEWL